MFLNLSEVATSTSKILSAQQTPIFAHEMGDLDSFKQTQDETSQITRASASCRVNNSSKTLVAGWGPTVASPEGKGQAARLFSQLREPMMPR